MKEFDVTITETLERTVTVRANSQAEAEQRVTDDWNDSVYVLNDQDFIGVDFKTSEGREIERGTMDVLLVKADAFPVSVQIGGKLEDLQEAVGGNIEAVYPYDDPVALIVNDEGKLTGLPLNRALCDEAGQMYDVVAGDFLVVGLTEDSFGSLSPELMKKYEAKFRQPELFIKMGSRIQAIPIPDDMVEERKAAIDAYKAKQKLAPTHAER